jgi:hypothetical protein
MFDNSARQRSISPQGYVAGPPGYLVRETFSLHKLSQVPIYLSAHSKKAESYHSRPVFLFIFFAFKKGFPSKRVAHADTMAVGK